MKKVGNSEKVAFLDCIKSDEGDEFIKIMKFCQISLIFNLKQYTKFICSNFV